MTPITRGDVFNVDLSGSTGCEKDNGQTGTRPCLIVQNDIGNRRSPVTIVAALTAVDQFKGLPVQVLVPANEHTIENRMDSVVECGHLRTIDRDKRIKEFRGKLNVDAMRRVDQDLAVSLGL